MFSKMCKYFNKKKDPSPDPEIMGAMIFYLLIDCKVDQ